MTDYDKTAALIQDKFDVKTTPEEIKKCCTSNKDTKGFLFFDHKPQRPWTLEFPLDQRTISAMKSNLS